MDNETLYRQNLRLLNSAGIIYEEYEHEAVLTYQKTAALATVHTAYLILVFLTYS